MKGQKGLTMVELVVATAISGVIVTFLGTAIYQILNVTGYGNDRLIAAHELENAAYWFNLDGQQAATASGGSALTLIFSDNSSVAYTLSGAELRRTSGSVYMVLARNIASLNFAVSSRVVTMAVTSTPPGRYAVSANGTYEVNLRPSGGG
ncbi:MAG: prepilin-type N-terminal cleavage/methylation domain-containing protein [Dehalococcoidales bacterium]